MAEEIDLEVLEERARRLGVTYRTDIKPETLLTKVEAAEAKANEVDTSAPAKYKNTTKQNIFTTAGRCKPQGVVTIPSDEAGKSGLELVKS